MYKLIGDHYQEIISTARAC